MQQEKRKILVVDNEPETVAIIKNFLSIRGYDVMGALSGVEVLNILKKEKVHLILLDIMMPGLKGTEVARTVKEKYPDVKLITITGYAKEAQDLSREKILEDIFIKPINVHELYNKLTQLFDVRESPIPEAQSPQGTKAHVLSIKARLLFIEDSAELYASLGAHFEGLADAGEFYESARAEGKEHIAEASASFNPDIFVVNAASFKEEDMGMIRNAFEKQLYSKEIIVYNAASVADLKKVELDHLKNSVKNACLKNGLVEVCWRAV